MDGSLPLCLPRRVGGRSLERDRRLSFENRGQCENRLHCSTAVISFFLPLAVMRKNLASGPVLVILSRRSRTSALRAAGVAPRLACAGRCTRARDAGDGDPRGSGGRSRSARAPEQRARRRAPGWRWLRVSRRYCWPDEVNSALYSSESPPGSLDVFDLHLVQAGSTADSWFTCWPRGGSAQRAGTPPVAATAAPTR
jgi:hypothetical protein